jgi:hypothetical protein
MRIAGFFLMVTGWTIAVAAVLLLRTAGLQSVFAVAALAVEALGFALIARSYLLHKAERHD